MPFGKLINLLRKKREIQALFLLSVLLSLIPLDFGRFDAIIGKIADAGHFWFYALFSYLVTQHSPKEKRGTVVVMLSLLSGVFEILQPYFNRDGNVQDFLTSSLGVVFGSWISVYSITVSRVLVGALLSIFLLLPAYGRYEALKMQEESWPNLSNFNSPYWEDFWTPIGQGHSSTAHLELRETGLIVVPQLQESSNEDFWPGVEYHNFEISWTGYKELSIQIDSPVAQTIYLRIDDKHQCTEYSDRFNRAIELHLGLNEIVLPLSEIELGPKDRKLNIGQIRRILFFLKPSTRISEFTIKSLRLVNPISQSSFN